MKSSFVKTSAPNTCFTCAHLHCREIQRRSCDLKTAGCGEWEEDRTGKIIEDIKGIVQVLDPEGFAWAQEMKREREGRSENNGEKS